MSTSLYRKFRPQVFEDVIGQDHIVITLRNQIMTGDVAHAYIFTGTRGTGKTTCAKILARAINCLSPLNGSPCGVCSNCAELSNNNNLDIFEMDAASNNSVDDIRDLRDKANYPPSIGKYKVYIIDEVHMLSTNAFNALLKTLEEPPPHVVFILATTEIHKVPQTILSRCIRFDFKLVSNELIAGMIGKIYEESGVKYEVEALYSIANAGAGSVRDALSIADMCMSYCNKNVTHDAVLDVVGSAPVEKLLKLAESIIKLDYNRVLEQINEMTQRGANIGILRRDLTDFFKNLIFIKSGLRYDRNVNISRQIFDNCVELVSETNTTFLIRVLFALSRLENEMRYSIQPKTIFESVLLQAMDVGHDYDEVTVMSKLKSMESKLEALSDMNIMNITSASILKNDANENTMRITSIKDPAIVWGKMIGVFRAGQMYSIMAAVKDVNEARIEDDKFIVCFEDEADCSALKQKDNYSAVQGVLSAFCPEHIFMPQYMPGKKDKINAEVARLKALFDGENLEISKHGKV